MSDNISQQVRESEHQEHANPAILLSPPGSFVHTDRQLPHVVVNPAVAACLNLEDYTSKKDGRAETQPLAKEEMQNNKLPAIANIAWLEATPKIPSLMATPTGRQVEREQGRAGASAPQPQQEAQRVFKSYGRYYPAPYHWNCCECDKGGRGLIKKSRSQAKCEGTYYLRGSNEPLKCTHSYCDDCTKAE